MLDNCLGKYLNKYRRAAPIFLALLFPGLFIFGPNITAQSGRHTPPLRKVAQKPPAQKTATPTPPPVSPDQTIDAKHEPPTGLPQAAASPILAPTANSPGEEIDPSDILRINSNLVSIPASVVDWQGHAVSDLKLEDFELRIDGQPKPISDLGRSESPVRMALLFDNSDSLQAARDFEKKAAVKFFHSVMRPIDEAAIYSVATESYLAQPLTSDVSTLVHTIESFGKPNGATALFDGVVMAGAYLKPHDGRKVIVIVSDGADTLSNLDFDTTLQRVLSADCQVYVVQTGIIENANLYDLAAARRMQDLSAQTGGAVYVPKGATDLDAAFAQISADLAQQYVLSYYPNDDRHDGRFRTIGLRVTTRPNMRVRARKGYYPPKATRKMTG